MTTDDETTGKDRSVADLLQLDTFQGMSDTEIASLIAFAHAQGVTQGGAQARTDEIRDAATALRSQMGEAQAKLQDSLDRALKASPSFKIEVE